MVIQGLLDYIKFLLKTIANKLGEAREVSYIYDVNIKNTIMEIVREFVCAITGVECIIWRDEDTGSEVCIEKPTRQCDHINCGNECEEL